MVEVLDYRLQIDWNGNGLYDHPLSDVTNDVLKSPLKASRGRNFSSQLYGRSVAGAFSFALLNSDKKYSPLAANSQLTNLVVPHRLVKLEAKVVDVIESVPETVIDDLADLASLTLSNGALVPAFDTDVLAYTVVVDNSVSNITVTAVALKTGATIAYMPSQTSALIVGVNTVTVVVTSADMSTTKTFTILITRQANALSNDASLMSLITALTLNPAFDAATYIYTASTQNDSATITVATSNSGATTSITFNGTLVSTTGTATVTLNSGDNTLAITVTAEDGNTQLVYTITVTLTPTLTLMGQILHILVPVTNVTPSGAQTHINTDTIPIDTYNIDRVSYRTADGRLTIRLNTTNEANNVFVDYFNDAAKSTYIESGGTQVELVGGAFTSGRNLRVDPGANDTDAIALFTSLSVGDTLNIYVADATTFRQVTGWEPLWTGFLDDIKEKVFRTLRREIRITALGPMTAIIGPRVSVANNATITAGEAFRLALQKGGVPNSLIGDMNASADIENFQVNDARLVDVAQQLEDFENSAILETKDGRITFEERSARARAFYMPSLTAVSDIIGVRIITANAVEPYNSIANIIRMNVRQAVTTTDILLWELPLAIDLEGVETEVIIARMRAGSHNWRVLNISANTAADGSGADVTGDLTVTSVDNGSEAVLTLENTSLRTLYVTQIQIRGDYTQTTESLALERRNADSIALYGERPYQVRSEFIGSLFEAREYSDSILSIYSNPLTRYVVDVSLWQNPNFAIDVDIGSKIDFDIEGAGFTAFVEHITHIITSGWHHVVRLLIVTTEAQAGLTGIILDTGPGLGTGTLSRS